MTVQVSVIVMVMVNALVQIFASATKAGAEHCVLKLHACELYGRFL